MATPPHILFLSTRNTCRSRMAAAWAVSLSGGAVRASAAGTRPEPASPLTVSALREAGIELGDTAPAGLDAVDLEGVTHLVTLCDEVARDCPPVALTAVHRHWGVSDPAAIAREFPHLVTDGIRAVRDNLRDRVTLLLRELEIPATRPQIPAAPVNESD